jgi:hypothetical protein
MLKEIIWERDSLSTGKKPWIRTKILKRSLPLCSIKSKAFILMKFKMMKRMILSFRQLGGHALDAPLSMISEKEGAQPAVNGEDDYKVHTKCFSKCYLL